MEEAPLSVLLVEPRNADQNGVESLLRALPELEYARARSLLEATTRLASRATDVVLLDLTLPDAGPETLRRLCTSVPEVPIVVLTGETDQRAAIQAVRDGAQDYLIKGRIDGELLLRSLRYAVERHRLLQEVRAMSLRDELTGLYNRRGFFTVVEQQLSVAARSHAGLAILFIDLDGMKEINDRLGHEVGDRALREVGDLLRRSLRSSDVVARLGGDEFVVLAINCDEGGVDLIEARIRERLSTLNGSPGREYSVEFSLGTVFTRPNAKTTVSGLLAEADAAMYAHKRSKRDDQALAS